MIIARRIFFEIRGNGGRQQRIFDFPDSSLGSDRELQILARDTVPVFVHHHHAQEDAERKEEEAIEIVLDGVTDGDAESEEKDLCDSVECDAEDDIAQGPTVIQGPEHEDQLRKCVRRDTKDGPNEVYDK